MCNWDQTRPQDFDYNWIRQQDQTVDCHGARSTLVCTLHPPPPPHTHTFGSILPLLVSPGSEDTTLGKWNLVQNRVTCSKREALRAADRSHSRVSFPVSWVNTCSAIANTDVDNLAAPDSASQSAGFSSSRSLRAPTPQHCCLSGPVNMGEYASFCSYSQETCATANKTRSSA